MSIWLWFYHTDYYLLDGASVLPVLALDLQPGDSVLDMCAAPGGKTLTILQTLMPRLMVANDVQQSRVRRIHNVINQFVNGIGQWEDRLYVTRRDARAIEDKDMFNKVILFPSSFSQIELYFNLILNNRVILFKNIKTLWSTVVTGAICWNVTKLLDVI